MVGEDEGLAQPWRLGSLGFRALQVRASGLREAACVANQQQRPTAVHEPKSSSMMFSRSTPSDSSIAITALVMGPGPQR